MDQFDGHPGTAKLAQVLDKRTSQKTESPLTLDFGEIQANGSLKTNTFPVPIPKGDYTVYTRNSILQECNQQDDLAEEVFEALDWQHVSSLLEDWQRNGELDTCKECGKMFNCYGVTKCPYCGADYEGGDE